MDSCTDSSYIYISPSCEESNADTSCNRKWILDPDGRIIPAHCPGRVLGVSSDMRLQIQIMSEDSKNVQKWNVSTVVCTIMIERSKKNNHFLYSFFRNFELNTLDNSYLLRVAAAVTYS